MNYVDPSTGATYALDTARWCADTGHYLNLGPAPGLRRSQIDSGCYSVWRYASALLVDSADAVTMGEGWTPLLERDWQGTRVACKLEFMMPTGSFKDRGMTVMVSYLKSRGIDHVLEDSSGNAGASLSAYAAAAGMRCRILVPETASYPKIAQIAACGAEVVTVKGSRQDVADAALRYSKHIFYASHNWQPFFAEGIASSQPTRVTEVLAAVRQSGGAIVAVSEEEIVAALGGLAQQGLYVEPTSAAAAAGLSQLLHSGAISADQTTVLVLTGSGLKASERIGQLLKLTAHQETP